MDISYFLKLLAMRTVRVLIPIAQKARQQPKAHQSARKRSHFYTSNGNRRLEIQIYGPPKGAVRPPNGYKVHVNLQPAGFCLPALGHDALFCSWLSLESEIVVLDVDYSKAPEHPFPSSTEDVLSALDWIQANAAENDWDLENLTIGGFSSGGCLALLAASQRTEMFKAVVAFYPS